MSSIAPPTTSDSKAYKALVTLCVIQLLITVRHIPVPNSSLVNIIAIDWLHNEWGRSNQSKETVSDVTKSAKYDVDSQPFVLAKKILSIILSAD